MQQILQYSVFSKMQRVLENNNSKICVYVIAIFNKLNKKYSLNYFFL